MRSPATRGADRLGWVRPAGSLCPSRWVACRAVVARSRRAGKRVELEWLFDWDRRAGMAGAPVALRRLGGPSAAGEAAGRRGCRPPGTRAATAAPVHEGRNLRDVRLRDGSVLLLPRRSEPGSIGVAIRLSDRHNQTVSNRADSRRQMRPGRLIFPRSSKSDVYYERHGVQAGDITRAAWRKSSLSGYNGSCFEVARLLSDRVGVRDTKDSGSGPVLIFNDNEWSAFLGGVKAGEFDSI